MGQWLYIPILQASLAVRECPMVAVAQRFRPQLQLQFVKFSIQRRFDVVVVDFTAAQKEMLYSEVEEVGRTSAVGRRRRGQIGAAVLANLEIHHRVAQDDLVQIDLFPEQRNDFQANHKFIGLKQRRPRRPLRPANRYAVRINGESRRMKREIFDSYVSSGCLACLLLNFCNHVLMKRRTTKNEVAEKSNDSRQENESDCGPAEFSFPRHDNPKIYTRSEGLTQGDIELRSFYPGHGIQVSTNVEADWSHRSRIPQSDADGVRVVLNEAADPDGTVNISPVIKDGCAQTIPDSQGETKFGIEYEQLVPSNRHPQVYARRGNLWIRARWYRPLGTGAINREAADGRFPTREETLARRDVAVSIGLRQPQRHSVRPNHLGMACNKRS